MSCYFTLFYCLLDLSCSECDVISLYFMCFSVNGSVCLVCCVFDSVCGSQVFALLMLFICVILHTMWLSKSLQLLCILPFGMLCLSAISMMFVKIMLTMCMLVGMVV